jgi:hypothetical protein
MEALLRLTDLHAVGRAGRSFYASTVVLYMGQSDRKLRAPNFHIKWDTT